MHILRLVHEYPFPWHGLTPGPYELSVAQVELGYQVTIVCGGYPHFRTYRDPRFCVLRTKATLPYIGPFLITFPVSSLRAWWYRRRHPVDVIHSHNHMGFYEHLVRKWQQGIARTPFVLHLHVTAAGREAETLAAGRHLDPITRYYEWPLHKLSDRIGCEIADAVICSSNSVRDEALKYYAASPDKLYVIPNGVNTKRFHPDGPDMRENLSVDAQDILILYVGGLNPRKNILPLVVALRLLPPNYKLLIVGSGSDAYVAKIRREAQAAGTVSRLILIGYVPYPELPLYYRSADVFVLPSVYEGFPKVILEALASGTPVIASASFVGDGQVAQYLFSLPNVSPEDIAQTVRTVIQSRPTVDVEAIGGCYDWTIAAKRIQTIYERIGAGGLSNKG